LTEDTRPPTRIRARGRSFLALVLSPEAPLKDWIAGLDHQIARSAQFFAGKPVIIDLGLLTPDEEGLSTLYSDITSRGVRIIGVEGADATWAAIAEWDVPDTFVGGRASGPVEIPDEETETPAEPPAAPPARTLLVQQPVRSGQIVFHPEGDVVIIGSVASGAEITAGGSIHVYGSLRGRAIAGVASLPESRIFATSMRAELLAIDGFYVTAEEIGAEIIGHPAQALLDGDQVKVAPLQQPAGRPAF